MRIEWTGRRGGVALVVWLLMGGGAVGPHAAELKLEMYPGLTITGEVGSNYVVQAVKDLANTNDWQNVVFLKLPSSPYLWFDTNASGVTRRMYRAIDTPKLTQLNGVPIPSGMTCLAQQPFGLQSVFTSQCGPGGCESRMWHILNDDACIPSQHDGLDAWADARLQGAFVPNGTQTFRVLNRGTTMFQNALAWYNVTGSQPRADELHTVLACTAPAGAAVTVNLQSEPYYLGGAIGFALVTPEATASPGTCAGYDCCATATRLAAGQGRAYYSERAYNPDSTNGSPFIHLLAYKSKVFPNRYYLACEDSFGAASNDFIDLVVAVDGVTAAP